MKNFRWFSYLILPISICSNMVSAQVSDCISAGIICDDGQVTFNASGPGIDDFASPNNSNGCLQEGERQSAWYYFEFMPNMPPQSQIEISISPAEGSVVDFDFAIYGPNLDCDSLGSPLRCSFAFSSCAFCPSTGLGNGAEDTSEGANGDGFLAPLTVLPGAGYYLLIDNWLASSTTFNLEWGGAAAAYLNCNADPNCPIVVDAGQDIVTCINSAPIQLTSTIDSTEGVVAYNWTASNLDHLPYLSDTRSPNPVLTIPSDFVGTLEYHLAVADNRCSATDRIRIEVTSEFAFEITGPNPFCDNIPAVLGAAEGFESYRWSTGATTPSITVEDPGLYGVTVTSVSGCVSIDTILLEEPLPGIPTPPVIFGDTILCNDASGAIRVLAYYETYRWSHGTRDPGTLITEGGTYSVTVTNEYGCPAVDSVEVVKVEATAEQVFLGENQDICYNEVITLDAGEQFVAYEWSDRSTGQQLKVEDPGLVCITAWDKNGCKSKDCIVISEIETPRLAIDGFPGFCQTGTTIGVSEPFDSYEWSTGSTAQDIFVDEPGLYSVTVTDGTCKDTTQVNVVDNTARPPTLDGPTAICSGEATTLVAEGGYQRYEWSTGITGPTVTFDSPGQYWLDVIGPEGCANRQVVNIKENPKPQPRIIGPELTCPYDTVRLEVEGEFTSFLWSNGAVDSTLSVISQGQYSVTVEDTFGCRGSGSITLENYDIVPLEVAGADNFCEGDFVIFSANEDYRRYLWSNGSEEPSIQINAPGSFELTVTDANGCRQISQVHLDQYSVPTIAIAGKNYLCGGESIELVAGDETLTYSWSTGDRTPSIMVSEPGTFVVEATNQNGCSDKAVIIVENSPNPSPVISGASLVCDGNGSELQVDGGYSSYSWSTGDTTAYLTAIHSGEYSVTVTDEKGCRGSTVFPVEIQEKFLVEITGDTLTCTNTESQLDAGGGFAQYNWSAGTTGRYLTINTPGMHTVTVTSEAGCIGEGSIEIVAIGLPEVEASVNGIITCDQPEVLLNGSAIGNGSPGFSYQWFDQQGRQLYSGSETEFPVTESGRYTLTATSAGDECRASAQVTVSADVDPPLIDLGTGHTLDCQTEEVLLANLAAPSSPGTLREWYFGNIDSVLATGISYATDREGKYFLRLYDEQNGCSNLDSVAVTRLAPPSGLTYEIAAPSCYGFSDGSIRIDNVHGGMAPYSFSLDGDAFVQEGFFDGLSAGHHQLTVRDHLNCKHDTTVMLREGSSLTVELGEGRRVGFGTTVRLEPLVRNAASSKLNWIWEADHELTCPTCDTQELDLTNTTTFRVFVTDEQGCEASDDITIQVQKLRELFIPNAFSPNSDGQNDVFFVRGGPHVQAIKSLQVYDRWGNLVFERRGIAPNDPTAGWDGTNRFQPLPIGVYAYIAEVTFVDGETIAYTGDISILK